MYSCPKSVGLTNINKQTLRLVPWTSHSALILSTLALLVASEGEYCSLNTITSLMHVIPVVARHQLTLWIVPLYRNGHWFYGLYTEHSLQRSQGQHHVRLRVIPASAVMLRVSSVHCSEKKWQEEQQRQSVMVCTCAAFRLARCYVRSRCT